MDKGSRNVKRKAEPEKDHKQERKSKQAKYDKESAKRKEKRQLAQPSKVKKAVISEPEDESEDSFDGVSDDGGAVVEEDSDDVENAAISGHDGVHPDRVKATFDGAGPNGEFNRSNILQS